MKKLTLLTAIFLATSPSAFAGAYMHSGGGSVVNWAGVSQTVAELCNSVVLQNATITQTGGGEGAAHSGGNATGGAGAGQQGSMNIPSIGVSSSISIY